MFIIVYIRCYYIAMITLIHILIYPFIIDIHMILQYIIDMIDIVDVIYSRCRKFKN